VWGVYQWLDRAPKGQNETGVWFRRHKEYDKGRARCDDADVNCGLTLFRGPKRPGFTSPMSRRTDQGEGGARPEFIATRNKYLSKEEVNHADII
jgi:hypothetical protein